MALNREEHFMNWADALREELRERAEVLPAAKSPLAYRSVGRAPVLLFRPSDDGRTHGNFFRAAWAGITSHPAWQLRLNKVHSQLRSLPPDCHSWARELDSSNSSDALLMNIFCLPSASARAAVVLGADPPNAEPAFGFNPRVDLLSGSTDETEVDMRLGDTLVEAKLTEADFKSREKTHVFHYKAFQDVFEVDLLPGNTTHFYSYQLIRNVLAAAQLHLRLVVVIDFRRPDLLQEWWSVHMAIRNARLRARCGVRFWQELAATLETEHAAFLEEKYGI